MYTLMCSTSLGLFNKSYTNGMNEEEWWEQLDWKCEIIILMYT